MSTARVTASDHDREAPTRRRMEPDPTVWGGEALTLRQGVFENLETGTTITVSPAPDPDRRVIRRDSQNHPFGVIVEGDPPIYHPPRRQELAPLQGSIVEPGIFRITDSGPMTRRQRQRRLEEHRIRVQLLRQRLGDPNEALDRRMAERFDPEVMRRLAREFAEDELRVRDIPDDEPADEHHAG